MDVESFGILSIVIPSKVMMSCVITTLKVNGYQIKSDLLRINFIVIYKLIYKKIDHAFASLGLTECILLLDNVAIS